MNELIINKIRIFIQKDLYIIYMNTLINHIKQRRKIYELFKEFKEYSYDEY